MMIFENTFGYLNTLSFLYIASNTNATSLAFLILRALATLYLDAASALVNMYFYVCPSNSLYSTKSRSN